MNKIIGVLFFICGIARAATLPTGLSGPEIDAIVQKVGQRSASKLLRPADALPLWPGIKLGVELNFVPVGNAGSSGNQDGSVPSFIFMPRVYLAKGLSTGIDLVLNFAPAGMLSPVGTFGGMLKYSIYEEKQHWAGLAAYAGYTSVTGFDSNYSGSDLELGAVATKDYVRVRPYLGLGFLVAKGTIGTAFVKDPENDGSMQATLHSFLGAEFHYPVDVTVQIDLMNLSLMGTVFVGKTF